MCGLKPHTLHRKPPAEGRKIRLPGLLLAVAATLAAADPAEPVFTVSPLEFTYAQRVEYPLGDGRRPFADEDQRRAHLGLMLRCSGRAALLGWAGLSVDAATSDRGEELALTASQPDGVFTASHGLRADPTGNLPALALPLGRLPVQALRRLSGHLDLRFSRGPARSQSFPLSALPANHEQAISGLDDGTLALTSVPGANAQLTVRLSRAAFLAVEDVVFQAADGTTLEVRHRRAEWRDDRGQLVITLKGPAPALAEVRWFPAIETRRVDFTCPAIDLGFAVPGRDDLRGTLPTGADGF